MLVVIGANGRSGVALVKEALRRGVAVRPVVRDDGDARNLEGLLDVNEICYADADQPASLPPVLEGAGVVVSCLDPRTAGHGAPPYTPKAAVNILHAAAALGVHHLVHLSVMGAYRWSSSALNRRSFHMDKFLKREGPTQPWSLMRISCYHDELIEGHIQPPDGGSPHPIKHSSRFTPISRADMARALLDILPDLVPGRMLQIGGPEVLSGEALNQIVEAHRTGSGHRTAYDPLPSGDMGVTTESTRVCVGSVPRETLAWMLDPINHALSTGSDKAFWERPRPGPHPSDRGESRTFLEHMGPMLRRIVHAQLIEDLPRLKLPAAGASLDFSSARPRPDGLTTRAHEGQLCELLSIRLLAPDGSLLYTGDLNFLHDELADDLRCWWRQGDDDLPEDIWVGCDLGVRRRLTTHPRWGSDPKVRAFAAANHERG
jgi:uncharacterized protein YbjT (DUF2867 family)